MKGLFNMRVAGGPVDTVLFIVSIAVAGGLFLFAAPGIIWTVGETSMIINYVESHTMEDIQFPGLMWCFGDSYQDSEEKIESRLPEWCARGRWDMFIQANGRQQCVAADTPNITNLVTQRLGNISQGGYVTGWCHSWGFIGLQHNPSRYEHMLKVSDITDSNFRENGDNTLWFYDPTLPQGMGGNRGWPVSPIATRTVISIQIVRKVDSWGASWHYEPKIVSVPMYTGTPSTDVESTLLIEFADSVRIETAKTKEPWEVFAELGGAWGGAMLVLGICFMSKSVPGKNKDSPNIEVQILRLRKVTNRKDLLSAAATAYQNAEAAAEALTPGSIELA